jgi:hypothetical protein
MADRSVSLPAEAYVEFFGREAPVKSVKLNEHTSGGWLSLCSVSPEWLARVDAAVEAFK